MADSRHRLRNPAAPPSIRSFENPDGGDRPPLLDDHSWRAEREQRFWVFTAVPSGLASAILHLLLLISLGLCVLATEYGAESISLQVVEAEPMREEELQDEIVMELDVVAEEVELEASPADQALQEVLELETQEIPVVEPTSLADQRPAFLPVAGEDSGKATGAGRVAGGAAGRSDRRQRAYELGATPESEEAVELALGWIVRHQLPEGGWNFDHRAGEHGCASCGCGHPGSRQRARNAATAFGLLPLLGAGHTHLQGEYREHVSRGLRYLLARQKNDGSWHEAEGNMYSHGLATLAVCEALAMTPAEPSQNEPPAAAAAMIASRMAPRLAGAEPPPAPAAAQPQVVPWVGSETEPPIERSELAAAAQRAMAFIERAQHRAGGWRYTSKQAGDTSVVGWQLMALKSGQLAGLGVDNKTLSKARGFLSAASTDRYGSVYGYLARRQRNKGEIPLDQEVGATTPIGLLCRMYTGWTREHPGVQLGVQRLDRWARPNKGMYYYYYATQVMHHHGGQYWDRWNGWMRGHLVDAQSRVGSEEGSWRLTGSHDDAGRLYCTAMAAMTLEVYYRYSPIYGEAAVGGEAAR